MNEVEIKIPKVKEELEFIAAMHDGVLSARDVVEFAKNPKTALHNRFEWDDDKAAEAYRLIQAQLIIRMRIFSPQGLDDNQKIFVRQYVSLTTERGDSEYRNIIDVLKNKQYRAQLLADAKAELRAFSNKYAMLEELVEVHNIIKKLTS